MQEDFDTNEKILDISEINHLVKNILHTYVPKLWITGEISNFIEASSGHWYFSLKDEKSQIRCTMFKGQNSLVSSRPKEGDKVEIFGLVSIYEPRGDYQFNAEKMRESGAGNLYEKFLALKNKLEKEGIFDQSAKKIIPRFPKQIGIITSPTGAAIRDVISTLQRLNPIVKVVVYPCLVQGRDAASTIVQQIQIANERNEVETLILCRGGGSIEDLWSFNEEIVVRAVFNSKLPVISGVGHETDFTLTDFVSDLRMPTPTAAAERASESLANMYGYIKYHEESINKIITGLIQRASQKIDFFEKRLVSPRDLIRAYNEKIYTASQMLKKNINLKFLNRLNQFNFLKKQIKAPYRLLSITNKDLERSTQILIGLLNENINSQKQKLNHIKSSIELLSPKNIMARGYSIVYNNGKIISSEKQANLKDNLKIILHEGQITAEVKNKYDK
jgi:exodeoxyribonuclease VII large subunit